MRRFRSFLTLSSIIALFSSAASQLVCYPGLTAVFTDSSSFSAPAYPALITSSFSVASLLPVTVPTSSSPPANSISAPIYSSPITNSLAVASLSTSSVPSSSISASSGSSSYVFDFSSATSMPVVPVSLSTFIASSLQSVIDAGHSSLIFGPNHTTGGAVSSATVTSIASSILVGASSRPTGFIGLSTSSANASHSSQAPPSSPQPSIAFSSNTIPLQTTNSALSSNSSAPNSSSTSMGAPSLPPFSSRSRLIPASSTLASIPLTSFLPSSSGSSFTSSTYMSTASYIPVTPPSNIPTSSSSGTPFLPSLTSSVISDSLLRFSSISPSSSSLPSAPAISTKSAQLSSSTLVTSSLTSTPTSTFTSTPTLNPGIGKRGLAYGNNTYTNFFALAGQNSRVSWAYNYFSLPETNHGGLNPALAFVPMLFNDAPALTSVFAANVNASIAQYRTDSILSFNEPDSCFGGSACMSVNESVAAYRAYIQPFAGRVLLGAPAVTNGGPPGSLAYLASFLGNCTGCTIDFVPIHWYASAYNEAYFQQYIAQAYNVSRGRPLWVTEFGMDQDYYDPDVQTFIKTSLAFLDNTTYVQRYAYFGAYPGDLKPNNLGTGFLINNAGTGLSAEGLIFNNYTEM